MLANSKYYVGDVAYPVKYKHENLIRAKFSSLARRDIIKAYRTMNTRIDDCKANARYAQEEIDLRLGKSFSVQLTNVLQNFNKRDKIYNVSTSYGPCQFPTFWFCYQRLQKIKEQGRIKSYWKAIIQVKANNTVFD
jgi:DNA topoisomerase-3